MAEFTFAPIKCFDSNCVNATAALFGARFATTTVRDPDVVTSAATFCTTSNRQFSLHFGDDTPVLVGAPVPYRTPCVLSGSNPRQALLA